MSTISDTGSGALTRRWLESSFTAAAITLALYVSFLFIHLRPHRFDFSYLVVAGGPSIDAKQIPSGLNVIPGIAGYDGMMFYRLALDPFTRERTAHGITFDNAAYRQQRIMYPTIVWLLSAGRSGAVPALLMIVNLAGLAVLAGAASAIVRGMGGHGLWGVIAALYPGFLMTLTHDTSEIVACAFVVTGLALILRGGAVTGAVLLALAVLSRETTVLVAVAFLAGWLIETTLGRERRIRIVIFLLPLLAFATWQLTLRAWWGVLPVRGGASSLAFPFAGYARRMASAVPPHFHQQRLLLFETLFLLLVAASVLVAWRKILAALSLRISWLSYLALAAIMPAEAWSEDVAFLRVLAEWFVLSAILTTPRGHRARVPLALMTCALWLYLAKHLVRYN